MVRGKRAAGYQHSAGQRGGASAVRGRGRGRGSASPAPAASLDVADSPSPLGAGPSASLGASASSSRPSAAIPTPATGKRKAKHNEPNDIESEGSSDEPKAPARKKSGPKPKASSEKKVAAAKSAGVIYLDPDNDDDALTLNDPRRCVTPSTIEGSDHLRNWKQWSTVKDDLRLKNLVMGTKPSLVVPRINSLLNRPNTVQNWAIENIEFVQQDRLSLPDMTYPPTTGCWAVRFTDQDAKRQIKPIDRTALIYGSLVDEDEQDRAHGVAINMLKFLNTSPLPKVYLRPTAMLAQMIVITSLAMYDADEGSEPMSNVADYIISEVVSMQGGFKLQWLNHPKERWEAAFQLYDRDMKVITGQRRITLNPKDVSLVNQVPDIIPDKNRQLIDDLHAPTWGNLDREALSDEEITQHEACIRLARYLQFVMWGACGDKKTLLNQVGGIASIYRSQDIMSVQTRTLANLYDDKKMFLTDGKTRLDAVLIKLTAPVKVDILNGAVPDIVVLGKAKDRTSVPLETMYQEYLSGSNVLDMFQAGCIAADRVNRMPTGTKLRNPCDHTQTERQENVHVCQMCEGLDYCQNMVYSKYTDLRVDRDCEQKTDAACHRSKGVGVRRALITDLGAEMEGGLAKTRDDRKARVDMFTEKHFDEDADCWRDGLLSGTRSEFGNVSGTRSYPFKASLDAAVCFYVDADGKTWYHHEDACVVTAQYGNYATNTWLKGSLRLAAEAKELEDDDIDAYEAIYNEFDHQMAVRAKYPFKRSSREKIDMSIEGYKEALDEMVEGVLSDPDETVPASIPTYTLKHGTFSEEDRKRIMRLIQQLIDEWEKKNGRALSKTIKAGLVGVPFPFWPGHKPKKWTWTDLERFLAYHYDTLWYWCDRNFDVDETPESILLEIVKQWIQRGGRGHLLFIPWTALRNHAGGLAMGHVYHGSAMRTSYPVTGPALTNAVRQRDDERCNMSIESRFENYLKSDYANEDYDDIVADLTEKVHRDRSCQWYKAPKDGVPKVNLQISTDKIAVLKRSNALLSGAYVLGTGEDDDFGQIDAADLLDDYEQTAADLAALLD